MTQAIAGLLMETLELLGVAWVVEALHLCTPLRGVRKPRATLVACLMLGIFRRDVRRRDEF